MNSHALMYADNTVLVCGNTSKYLVRKNIQEDINVVQEWCKLNKLTLNIKKTKCIIYMSEHKGKSNNPYKIHIKGQLLDEVNEYKYLGTIIDNMPNGEPQYNALIRNLSFNLRSFGKIRRYLTNKAVLMVYKSTILPVIDYNDHYQDLLKVDKLQQNWGLLIVYSQIQKCWITGW